METEIEVVRVLHRTAKALRRGDNLQLVESAKRWEQKLQGELEKLERQISKGLQTEKAA